MFTNKELISLSDCVLNAINTINKLEADASQVGVSTIEINNRRNELRKLNEKLCGMIENE